jgi:hypothetical protein
MKHEIVSVYFPDEDVVAEIRLALINSNSVSNFIVTAVKEKLAKKKGQKDALQERPMQVHEDDNEQLKRDVDMSV